MRTAFLPHVTPVKRNYSPFLLALGLLALSAVHLHAESVFETTFDESIYQVGAGVPAGPGRLTFGRWGVDQENGFSQQITEEKSVSAPRSLCLERSEASDNPNRPARIWAGFQTELSGDERLTKAFSLSFAFCINRTDGGGTERARVAVSGASGTALFAVDIGVEGAVIVRHKDFSGVVGEIAPDQWYFLEILCPDIKQPAAKPVINLYEAKGEERGKHLGAVEAPELNSESIYAGFQLSNTLPKSKIFFDDFRAVIKE